MNMKLIKYGFGLLLSVLLVSCASKWPEYTVVTEDVSWESDGDTYSLDAEETPITISLQRGIANEAISVPITLNDKYGAFTLSTSKVDFAVGEYKKTITLTYDYSTLVPGTDYTFTLEFDKGLADAGCYYAFNGNGMMQLIYEDYKTGTYDYYVYKSGSWIYEDGCILPEFADTKAKLERAKGTTAYYRLTIYGDLVVEFKTDGEGSIIVKKYSGYNEPISYNSSNNRFTAYWGEGNMYYFQCLLDYSGLYVDDSAMEYITSEEIQSGNDIEITGWLKKSDAYVPFPSITSNTYQEILID
jgi:hypothetical protein